jgi:hypothetical protein
MVSQIFMKTVATMVGGALLLSMSGCNSAERKSGAEILSDLAGQLAHSRNSMSADTSHALEGLTPGSAAVATAKTEAALIPLKSPATSNALSRVCKMSATAIELGNENNANGDDTSVLQSLWNTIQDRNDLPNLQAWVAALKEDFQGEALTDPQRNSRKQAVAGFKKLFCES